MRRRVVITGMGAITPLGHSVDDHVHGPGRGPQRRRADHPLQRQRVPDHVRRPGQGLRPRPHRAAPATAGRTPASTASSPPPPPSRPCDDAGLLDDTRVDRTRFGVYLGSGEGIQDFHSLMSLMAQTYRPERQAWTTRCSRPGLELFHAGREPEQELHRPAGHLGAHFDLQGPNYNCLTACAASSQAIGEAAELIRHGDADLMLSGGSHSMIHPFGVTGFNLLTALSTRNDDPAQGVAAVRPAPRRLRARRRRRHAGPGGAGARPAARARRSTPS